MKKQTALEFLLSKTSKHCFNQDDIEQAKQMQKEQIVKTYRVGIHRGMSYDEDIYHDNNWRSGEKYYNETFN